MLRTEHFIGGAFTPSNGKNNLDLENPATLSFVGSVGIGDECDVDRAVAAAVAAQPDWAASSVKERAAVLSAMADGLKARAGELAELLCAEMGVPITIAQQMQVPAAIMTFETYATLVQEFRFQRRERNSDIYYESAGVVGAITPWNMSLFLIACKVAPALAAGSTVVLKPSELTSLSALILAEIVRDAGVPPGVINIVTGDGATTGTALVSHPSVRVVSFTGSGSAGKEITKRAADTVKNVALELGGKSASVVLDDADIEVAVQRTLGSAFNNSGQICAALTRLLVHRSRYDEALESARSSATNWRVGDPTDPETRMGPVASRAQYEKVTGMIKLAVSEGATVLAGEAAHVRASGDGYFVQPTVLVDVDPKSTAAREEIFGPVLVIIPFSDEDEAVAIANGTSYGLSGAVWSADEDRAIRIARRMEAGAVSINGNGGALTTPFGGVKESGRGREWGEYGLMEFLEPKAIHRADAGDR